jgi:hypothetical protein
MYCLYCGDCCKRMSPLTHPNPCPQLIKRGTFYFCGTYDKRPTECKNHEYPARFCPIGIDVLKLDINDTEALHKRVDDGWEIIQSGFSRH